MYINKFYANMMVKLKNCTLIRLAIKSVVEKKRALALAEYVSSEESNKLRLLKDVFSGERCFIIGNGPSLTIGDLEKLSDEYTFGANGIHKLFSQTKWRPTFYTCVDTASFHLYGTNLANIECKYKFFDIAGKKHLRAITSKGRIIYLYQKYPFKIHRWEYEKPLVSEDVSKGISLGYTVTFTAIQLAIYMGFKEIYLIGVDHSYSKQVDSKGKIIEDKNNKSYCSEIGDNGLGIQYTDITTAAYQSAREYAEKHGIVIKNATRGGKLEIFERVDLDTVLCE